MSENPFASVPEDGDDEVTPDRRKLVLGGALAAVVLAGGGFLLLSGGSGDEESLALPVRRPAPTASPSVAPLQQLPPSFRAPVGRDPFRVLYTAPIAAPAGGAVAAPAPSATPLAPTGTTGSTGTTGGTTGASGGSTTTLHSLVLKEVRRTPSGDLEAVFLYDGVGVAVGVGDVFGAKKEVMLVSLQQEATGKPWTATIKVGDGAAFTVQIGEKNSVQ